VVVPQGSSVAVGAKDLFWAVRQALNPSRQLSVALSLLYLAFVRTLQLRWRNRSEDNDLAIEIVMLP